MPAATGPLVRIARKLSALFVVAVVVGGVLRMHRGLLLSDGIRGHFWPWAPSIGRPVLTPAASALSDPVWQFVPWIELARSELRAGRVPLWTPHQEAGQPLLGNAQSALGSPLLWPALALPLFPGWNLSLLLRILVSAAGGWALARDCGRTRVAALLAAIVCSLSGPFIAWLEHPQTLTAAAVPGLLPAVRRSVRAEGAGRIAAVAGATALVLAGGHHETALMAAFLALVLLASESASVRDRRGRSEAPSSERASLRRSSCRSSSTFFRARPGRVPIVTWSFSPCGISFASSSPRSPARTRSKGPRTSRSPCSFSPPSARQ